MNNLSTIVSFITDKTKRNAAKYGDRLPAHTKDGVYEFSENGFWTGGFWTGLNWLSYELTGDESFIRTARDSYPRLLKRLYDTPETLDHDIGFLYSLSFVADYKITGNPEALKVALDAADRLAERFNEKGQFIQAWNVWKQGDPFSEENRGRIIIDCMYNLPLLFWASEITGNQTYRQIAESHANTCMSTIIRSDFTAYHTFVFDPVTGEPKFGQTHQGYADESVWSRGQTWAIGGYTHAYRYTGNDAYLNVARNCAKVFLDKVEPDLIPLWDFSVPDPKTAKRDSSAAAIAAASLLELTKFVEGSERSAYETYANQVVQNLFEMYSTNHDETHEGLLIHGCGHHPAGKNIDCSLIYGDYYFVEAVARLLGKTKVYW
ncbi:Unsaturated glucuronyl hydrolase [Paenibacillus allorhizoplanae]|uniref:Unsaturated glucuronyl hydrolase n=1 Tax=Paenibacillus allorhizoplanae TaxID=2905648 RepID=A0ABN8HB00_9BACL|nr:glycoside hydrolase family 88 protein [Paenibacillus allorhizoplanae]CAH1226940.1 Unsaturated glucuronyl hydrolase [Paenibacillus allorhizoplanae]